MAKQWTALPRSCCGYHREEVSLFPDAGNGGPQESAFCGELRHRRQTVRPSEPQSRLQPDLVDLVALLRKTVFLHETNKRHVPFSAHRFGHTLHSRRFGECLRTVPRTASVHPAHDLDGSRKPRFLQGDCIARGTLGDSYLDPRVSAHRLGFHPPECNLRRSIPASLPRPSGSATRRL